ncbi:reprolysin-like metallopeptidase [Hymenobacter sp. BT491]|uniref:reprolysin-like metallopeptidase n=1 Tax=Hymenobacter sp. BT491 TaxID=2766779 RepID=UPI001653564D|nr:zinc-dependent metalloprotease family protein [Hymenobacter sp. BT491]MBC6988260.1 T9SS type A sorting domain-containing protein [Hymenobacter sp. BT491]
MAIQFTRFWQRWRASLLSGLLVAAAGIPRESAAQRVLWADDPQAPAVARRHTKDLLRFRPVSFQLSTLREVLKQAPAEKGAGARNSATVVSLPLPDGTSGRFRVATVPVMAPELAARYPQIRTYEAQGIDDPSATARLDVSPAGFHAQILTGSQTIYIDPASSADATHHLVFSKQAMAPNALGAVCLTGGDTQTAAPAAGALLRSSNGTELRTYRLAVACTGEYAATKQGTKEGALAGIVTSVNRVSGIYERELAIRLVLVAKNDTLIFLDGTTDPYTNNNGEAMLDQNQSTVDQRIGDSKYDIGHVFSTGGGGIAQRPSVCVQGKARGVTGLPNPVGDAFDVDFVAHEMGHQFGADHTFNSTSGNCSGNRSSASAYEPGSGTSIMAYAGICAIDNIQTNSDPYFHSRSFDQILAHVTGPGNCATVTPTGNHPPVVNAGANYRIPISTPFALSGSATDPDGDALTYSWEEYDLGPSGNPNAPTGNAPLFRVFAPVTSGFRTFPRLADLLGNTHQIGELLPSYARKLMFRLVARDNRAGGGGVDYDSMNVAVVGTAGPFVVTAPNTVATWQAGASQLVTWDVSNTNQAPISASNVDILLSTDGGLTFPVVLAANTPNDGCESITVPAGTAATTGARLKVQAVGNIFFDISDQNFIIQALTGPTFYLNSSCVEGSLTEVCPGNSVVLPVGASTLQGFSGNVELSAGTLPTGLSVTFAPASISAGTTSQATISVATGTAPGIYVVNLTGTSNGITQSQQVRVRVRDIVTQVPTPTAPTSVVRTTTRARFEWSAAASATSYDLQVATDAGFTNLIVNQTSISGTTFTLLAPLQANTVYYWRVRGNGLCGPAAYSAATQFQTSTPTCQVYPAAQVPVAIPADAPATATSVIPVSTTEIVSAIAIRNLTLTHANVGELQISLTNPAGRTAILIPRICAGTSTLTISLDETAAAALSCPLTAGATYRPANSLSELLNSPANGNWTLTINDNAAGNGGALTGWSLELCTVLGVPNAPTSLIAFANGTANGTANIDVQWTDNATNETGFELERSPDNNTAYQRIATLPANTTTYTDPVALSGRYYYRVRAVNSAGPSAYSNESIASVVLSSQNAALLKGVELFPNPSAGVFQLTVDNGKQGSLSLRVTDALGRSVTTETLTKSAAPLHHRLDLSQLAKGVYQLHLTLPEGTTVLRLLKE